MLRLERIRDVFEEDEAQDDVLVLRRVHVVAQRVRRFPEPPLEARTGRGRAPRLPDRGPGELSPDIRQRVLAEAEDVIAHR